MMRRTGGLIAFGAFVLASVACGSGSETPSRATATIDAGTPPIAERLDAAAHEPPPAFAIEEEPASACAATTSAAKKALTSGGLYLSDLDVAGNRLLARDFAGKGVVTFDRSGADVTSLITLGSDPRAAATTTGFFLAGIDDPSGMIQLRAFDLHGTPTAQAQPLGSARFGRAFTIARTTSATLATWVAPQFELRARVIDDGTGLGGPIRLEDGAEFDDLSIVAAPSPTASGASETGRFLVVWALRRLALSSYRVYSAIVGKDGVVGLTRMIFGGDERITLAKIVTREGGATLLANRDGEPLVVPLDSVGRIADTARLFRGARDPNVGGGQGLALGGDRVAVVVAHESGASALRILGVDAKPRDGWVCLDSPSPDGFHLGSIVSDGEGWKVLVASGDGSALLDVDGTGMNAR